MNARRITLRGLAVELDQIEPVYATGIYCGFTGPRRTGYLFKHGDPVVFSRPLKRFHFQTHVLHQAFHIA